MQILVIFLVGKLIHHCIVFHIGISNRVLHSLYTSIASNHSSSRNNGITGEDSVATLQYQTSQQSGITSKDLLAIARAKASLGANIAGLDSSANSEITPIQWTDYVTMSHTEVSHFFSLCFN